jgi:hypothetical protein
MPGPWNRGNRRFPPTPRTSSSASTSPAKAPTSDSRARETTNIYAAQTHDPDPDRDRLRDLAERMNRTEPDVPSIRTPLAHETALTNAVNLEASSPGASRPLAVEPRADSRSQGEELRPETTSSLSSNGWPAGGNGSGRQAADPGAEAVLDTDNVLRSESSPRDGRADIEGTTRRWPRERSGQAITRADDEGREPERSIGLEP